MNELAVETKTSPTNPYLLEEIYLSHSSLKRLSCPRKWEFSKLYGISRASENFHGDVGNAMHEGYQSFLLSGSEKQAVLDMMMHYPIENQTSPANSKSIEACYITLEAMMASGLYSSQELARVEVDGEARPAIEVYFQIEITGIDIYNAAGKRIRIFFRGFIDMLYHNFITDRYSVVDIKTHAQANRDRTLKYKYDMQMKPYALVLSALLQKELDAVDVSIMDVMIDMENPAITEYPIVVTRDDYYEWAFTIKQTLVQMKEWIEKQHFPRAVSGDTCFAYNRSCVYGDNLCMMRKVDDLLSFKDFFDTAYTPLEERTSQKPWINLTLELVDA